MASRSGRFFPGRPGRNSAGGANRVSSNGLRRRRGAQGGGGGDADAGADAARNLEHGLALFRALGAGGQVREREKKK